MSDSHRAKKRNEPTFPAWKAEALKALQREHDVAVSSIPERVWESLYVRQLDPPAAATRAEVYCRSIRPAGLQWRKRKK